MPLASRGEPLLRHGDGGLGRTAIAEEEPEPAAQRFQATAGPHAQDAHPGQLGRDAETAQQPRFSRSRRSTKRELRSAPTPRARGGLVESRQLAVAAEQRAEPDAVRPETFAFSLQ